MKAVLSAWRAIEPQVFEHEPTDAEVVAKARRRVDESGWYADARPWHLGGYMGAVWAGDPPLWIVPMWAATEDEALAGAYVEALRIEFEREPEQRSP